MRHRIVSVANILGLPVILVLLWWASAVLAPNVLFPDPGKVVQSLVSVWFSDRIWEDVVPSLLRLFAGLGLAVVVGAGAGIVIGLSRVVRETVEPTLEFIRAIPVTILVPVLLLVIGINDAMKIVVIAFGCVWPILLNTVEGVRGVDEVQSDTARCYHLTGLLRLRTLVVPSAMPQIFAGIRQSLSIGLILMVVSEMFAARDGLGFAIIQFQRIYAIPQMWSGIVVLGLIGVGLSVLFKLVQRRVLRWYLGLKSVTDA